MLVGLDCIQCTVHVNRKGEATRQPGRQARRRSSLPLAIYKTTGYSMSLSPFVCVHFTFELHTRFQSIFKTLRAMRVPRAPFGLCQLAAVLRRPHGMRSTVWCPKRRCEPFSSPTNKALADAMRCAFDEHKEWPRGGRSEFNWGAIESALT